MKSKLFALAICAAVVSGCTSNKLVGRPDLKVLQNTELPAPALEDALLQQRSYLIGPMDKVAVDVYGVPELSRTLQVDASGTIALPLIGTLNASGKSPQQLSEIIATKLRGRYVRDPQVTVSADTVNQVVTVEGLVKKPGLYPVLGRMTLMRAVASAEGEGDFADVSYVVVFRRVNNQQMAALYDLRAIRQGIYADPEVYANDVVSVGESEGRRLFSTVISTGAILSGPLLALVQKF